MFAEDTNLFLSHKNHKTVFQAVNRELHEWFKANKLRFPPLLPFKNYAINILTKD